MRWRSHAEQYRGRFESVEGTHRLVPLGDSTGQMFVGTAWFQHHIRSGWGASGGFRRGAFRDKSGVVQLEPVAGASEFRHNFRAGRKYPNSESNRTWLAQRSTDAAGIFITWPSEATAFNGKPALRNWNDTGEGKIYSGKPPAGNYIPLDSVGLNYRLHQGNHQPTMKPISHQQGGVVWTRYDFDTSTHRVF